MPRRLVRETPEVIKLRKELKDLNYNLIVSKNESNALISELEKIFPILLNERISMLIAQKHEEVAKKHECAFRALNVDPSGFTGPLERELCEDNLDRVVARARKWIFKLRSDDALKKLMLEFLLEKVKLIETSDILKLNILYVMDDWLAYSKRKKEIGQTMLLSKFVPMMFAYCLELTESDELKKKLKEDLMEKWDNNEVLTIIAAQMLRNTRVIVQSEKEMEVKQFKAEIDVMKADMEARLKDLEEQRDANVKKIKCEMMDRSKRLAVLRNRPFVPEPAEEPSVESTSIFPSVGLMQAVVRLNNFTFEPIDPAKMKMPSRPPNFARLVAAKSSYEQWTRFDRLDDFDEKSWNLNVFPFKLLNMKQEKRNEFVCNLKKRRTDLDGVIKNKPTKKEEAIYQQENERQFEEMVKDIRKTINEDTTGIAKSSLSSIFDGTMPLPRKNILKPDAAESLSSLEQWSNLRFLQNNRDAVENCLGENGRRWIDGRSSNKENWTAFRK